MLHRWRGECRVGHIPMRFIQRQQQGAHCFYFHLLHLMDTRVFFVSPRLQARPDRGCTCHDREKRLEEIDSCFKIQKDTKGILIKLRLAGNDAEFLLNPVCHTL